MVDDNRDSADSLVELLDALGAQARAAYDGEQALEAVTGFRPDLVFLDLGMPGRDGYDVAAALRQQPEGSRAHLVALTGWGNAEERQRTAEAGFDAHLVKPVALDDLRALLSVRAR